MKELLEKMNKESDDSPEGRKFGSCVIILRGNQFLALERSSKALFGPDKWGFPGGGSDPGESPEETAARETLEETGLVVNELVFLTMKVGNKGKFVYFFVCDDFSGEVDMEKVKEEHKDYAWVEPHEMKNYDFVDKVEDLVGKLVNGKVL